MCGLLASSRDVVLGWWGRGALRQLRQLFGRADVHGRHGASAWPARAWGQRQTSLVVLLVVVVVAVILAVCRKMHNGRGHFEAHAWAAAKGRCRARAGTLLAIGDRRRHAQFLAVFLLC